MLENSCLQAVRFGPVGKTRDVRVSLISYESGTIEFRGAPLVGISIHVGRAARLQCRRGEEWHRGLVAHGDVAIAPPTLPGVWNMRDAGTALVVCLDLPLVHHVVGECGGDPSRFEIRNRLHDRDLRIENIGWAMKAELEGGGASGPLYMDCLATALAVTVVRAHSSLAVRPSDVRGALAPKQLREVVAFMDAHLDRRLHLSDLAAVSGLGLSRFKTGFRKATGVSVYKYLIRRRVEHAAQLLRTSDLPLDQVALDAGFCHQSHLALHMRRLLGTSPAQLQESIGDSVLDKRRSVGGTALRRSGRAEPRSPQSLADER